MCEGSCRGHKGESYILELELHVVMAGNRTWGLWKNSKHSTAVLSLQALEVISTPGAPGPGERLLLSVIHSIVSSAVCGSLRIYSEVLSTAAGEIEYLFAGTRVHERSLFKVTDALATVTTNSREDSLGDHMACRF